MKLSTLIIQAAEYTDRYNALGIATPNSKEMCQGECEGTGIMPIKKDDPDPIYKKLWDKAEEKKPTDDGWHFIECPECNGTGNRLKKISAFLRLKANYDQYIIEYGDWSEFENKFKELRDFNDEKELIEQMHMNFDMYNKITKNMIYHWKDSVSKSLIHSIAELNSRIPTAGTKMFKNLLDQTRALLIMGPGASSRNIFGETTDAHGLRIMSHIFDYKRIGNEDPNDKDIHGNRKRWIDVGGYYAITVEKPEALKLINKIIQYIWLYVYYHKQKLNDVKKKIPKYLYRGIRISNLFSENDIKEIIETVQRQDHEEYFISHAKRVDLVIDYILNKGIDKIIPGKFLSFTASQNIAEYFTNGEGIILRINPSKVDIITSELTEPLFAERDYISNKKEREYIVKIPEGYRFTPDDIIITDLDWFIAKNNPLCVQYFDHNDKGAKYTLNGKNIHARYYWHSNTRGSVEFKVILDKENWNWLSRTEFKKEHGFDPMPSEKNLDQIKNFQFIKEKSY